MNYRHTTLWLIGLAMSLASILAQASYVLDADGVSLSAESGNVLTMGADFDVVTHDFGTDSGDAIQIALTNLSSSAGLSGNLLLWSHIAAPNAVAADTASDDLAVAGQTGTADVSGTGSNDDFSYYDDGIADERQTSTGVVGYGADADLNGNTVAVIEPLPASVQQLPTLDASAIFWILKPAEFESFSQMIAARFGF